MAAPGQLPGCGEHCSAADLQCGRGRVGEGRRMVGRRGMKKERKGEEEYSYNYNYMEYLLITSLVKPYSDSRSTVMVPRGDGMKPYSFVSITQPITTGASPRERGPSLREVLWCVRVALPASGNAARLERPLINQWVR